MQYSEQRAMPQCFINMHSLLKDVGVRFNAHLCSGPRTEFLHDLLRLGRAKVGEGGEKVE